MIRLYSLLLFIPSIVLSQIASLSIEDIWVDYDFYPRNLGDLHWVGDSDFAKLENQQTFKPNIATYSIKSGRKTGLLLESKKYENFIKNIFKSKNTSLPEGARNLNNFLISDFQISPDNDIILLEVGRSSLYRYSTKSYLLIYDMKNSVFSFLPTKSKVFCPQFSPNGQYISFISGNNIFIYDIKKETTKKLTKNGYKNEIINGMSDWVYEEEFELTQAYEWSPDSKQIAYISFDETEVKTYNMQIWGNDLYPTNYIYKYPKAGEPNSKISVFTVSVDLAVITLLKDYSKEDIYIPRLYWLKDKVTILKMNRLQNELVVLQFDHSKKRKEQILYKENAENYIEWKDHLYFLPGGFVLSNETSGYRHLYYYNYEGQLINQLTSGNWEIDQVFGESNGKLYFSSTQKSIFNRAVYKVGLDGKRKIIVSDKGVNTVHISPNGAFLVNSNSSVLIPNNYKVLDSEGSFVRLIDKNQEVLDELSNYQLPNPDYFLYENSNGDTINACFLKPVDFDSTKKYPVLVYVYGGPGHQVLKNEYDSFNFLWHSYLTQQGFLIALIDARGTGGRGRQFREQTYGKLGELESKDISEMAEHIKSMPFIDENRAAIWGWSFGGYLSSLIAMQGGVFNVAIAVAPVTNWRFYDNVYAERYLGLPSVNADGYDWNSPTNIVDGLDAKYLLIHGTGDDNVHIQNSLFMQNALIDANKQFDVFYYPDRNHGIYGGNTRLHLYHLMTDYLIKYL